MSATNRAKRKPLVKKYRSTLEDKVIEALKEAELAYEYETLSISYQKKPSKYTPDLLLDNGIIIEVKGYFDAADRSKHLLIKDQHPELDIRFVFQSSKKKIHKSSPTTYADWCERHGFQYADSLVPEEWTKEKKEEDTRNELHSYKKPKRRKAAGADSS